VQVEALQIVTCKSATGRRVRRRKTRLITLEHLDRRSVAYRDAMALVATYVQALGGASPDDRLWKLITRAAALQALAEDRRTRVLNGDTEVTLNDLVRLDHLADQARRQAERELGKAKRSRVKPSALDALRPVGAEDAGAE
jgi:hypothetical protein